MSETERKLRNKRVFRLSVVLFVLVITFQFLGTKGYWIDTRVMMIESNIPAFFGSIWFNLIAVVLPALAAQVLNDGSSNGSTSAPRGISFIVICVMAVLAPFFGLFTIVSGVILIIILVGIAGTLGVLFPKIWMAVPSMAKSKINQLFKWILTVFWPEK